MSGPPPKHPSVRTRRNDPKKDFRVLSADGREGEVPDWPLPSDVGRTAQLEVMQDRMVSLQVELEGAEDGRTRGRLQRELNKLELSAAQLRLEIEMAVDAERALWADLWAMPQAVMWEEAHAHREVAQYVRWKIRAESGNLDAGKEARMLSDRLGLNPLALLRLRAEVERVDEAEDQGARRRSSGKAKPKPKKPPEDPRSILSVV